jgi:hypothetical protein
MIIFPQISHFVNLSIVLFYKNVHLSEMNPSFKIQLKCHVMDASLNISSKCEGSLLCLYLYNCTKHSHSCVIVICIYLLCIPHLLLPSYHKVKIFKTRPSDTYL